MTAWMASCKKDGKKVIGVVAQGRTHMFWQTIHAGAEAGAREINAEVSWNAPTTETDYNGQLQIVDAMITRHVDALCMSPIDSKAMVSVVERAVKEKIPVVIFDSGVDTESYTSWVATDNYGAGQMAASRIGEILGGKGTVAIVAALPGVASTNAREAGFEERMKKDFPGIQIVDKRFGNSDFAKSLSISENMLTAFPELNAFFASNESSSVGAAQALKGRPGSKVKLVGFDWSPNLVADLKAGVIDSLVAQDPFRIGLVSVQNAGKALAGQPVEKVVKLPARLLTKDNLGDPEVEKLLNPDLKKYLG
jgi:ribose transport system substrate-binding protein